MKIAVLTGAALLIATGAQGKSGTERQATVYLCNGNVIPFVVKAQAEALASEMFAGIRVTLNLREVRPPASETAAIIIEFGDRSPTGLLPGAFAYSLPYEGIHIRIFWDRMQYAISPETLLAHVMVHEITHILQGVPRHSDRGIMNARWTSAEMAALRRTPLQFTDEDVNLIYQGMDARDARGPNPAEQTSPRCR
jgi:hypothetical protein